jgi:general nucleoside transport system permease protein
MKEKKSILDNQGLQSVIAALICIVLGVLVGFIVLLIINPSQAWTGITAILKNFFNYPIGKVGMKYFGSTLVKTAPLLMCALSVCFCYKVGLFNIGAAGQYALGAGVALYCAIALQMPWYLCLLFVAVAGALSGLLIGVLKAFRNVNEVISGIMLNWISLYCVNMLLGNVKEPTSPYTLKLQGHGKAALLPSLGLDTLFNNDKVTIAIPLAIICAILVWIVLNKTKFGYELVATGYNKDAAKYAGMAEKKNIIVTLAIGGALAALGAAFFYLSGTAEWEVGQTSVPAMGFNGIAATFLGGLNPIGSIFSSFFIQHITDGAVFLDKTAFPSQIPDLITAIIIYLCGFMGFIRVVLQKLKKKGGNK